MQGKTFISLTLPVALGLMACPAPTLAQDGRMAMGGGAHEDMFFTAPEPARENVRIIGDDRFKDEPIVVSPKQTEYGTFMIIEGDMILGKREQLVLANLIQLREEARSLKLGHAGLGRFLSKYDRAIIERSQTLPSPGAEQESMLREAVAQSRIAPLVSRATQLVKSVGDKDGFLPEKLVEAVKKRQSQPQLSSVAIVGLQFRWPKGVIPYFYDTNTLPSSLQQTIEEAVAHWNQATDRIFLRKTTGSEPYWVEFVSSSGCASNVGKVVQSGPQQILLGTGCAFDQVVHEIGHAVGCFHEQTRNDRDKFLSIQTQNAIDGTASNFQLPLRGEAQDVGPFDFASVMLYASDAFTKNGLPTMVVKEAIRAQVGDFWGINHRQGAGLKGLSKGDVAGVAFMYSDPADRDPNLDLKQFVASSAAPLPSSSGGTRPVQGATTGGQPVQLGSPPVPPANPPGPGAGQGHNGPGSAPAGQPVQLGAPPVRPAAQPDGTGHPQAGQESASPPAARPAPSDLQAVPPEPKAETPK